MQKERVIRSGEADDINRRLDIIHKEFFGKHVRQVIEKHYNIRASSMRELYRFAVDIFIDGNSYSVRKYGKELGSFIFYFPSMTEEVLPEVEAPAEEVAADSEVVTPEAPAAE